MHTVLITGASSGIGLELAKIFFHNNYQLILVAPDMARLQAAAETFAQAHDPRVRCLAYDLTEPDAAQRLYNQVHSLNLEVEILVNNAGFGDYGLFHTLDLEKQKNMIQLNITAVTELTYLFGKEMVAHRSGKILQVASIAAFMPGPLMAVYYATKQYVLAFSEALHNEWQDFGVTVTALCPGPTHTQFAHTANAQRNGVFSNRLPGPTQVAQTGFNALMQGKAIAIPRFQNKLIPLLLRFLPRSVIRSFVRRRQESK